MAMLAVHHNLNTMQFQTRFDRLYSRNSVHQILRTVPNLDYQIIGDLIEVLVEQLDFLAGDCDFEEDDPCGGNVEDEGEIQKFDWQRYSYHSIDQRIIYDFESSVCEVV